MPAEALASAQAMAAAVTDELGGAGLFGVEFFLCRRPDGSLEVVFSELSPRPHDTGLVTLVGQNLSEFELHLRAVLGLPIPEIRGLGAAASRVILAGAPQAGAPVSYRGVATALAQPESQVLLFGKPEAWPQRRMGVALARGVDLAEARRRADAAAAAVEVLVG
jgi:phosphoribosylglycinamide formyltransferase 2